MRYSQKYLDEVRAKIPDVAFKMFAERGIESVSIQNIADEVKLGHTTMYRYYSRKNALVISIAAKKWNEYAKTVEENYNKLGGEKFTAKEEIEFYLDSYIELYKSHKDLLKFNRNFDIYVLEEKPTVKEMQIYYDSVDFFRRKFHAAYTKALTDKTVRTDIPEEKVFFGIMYSMLAAAAKYACGIIYPVNEALDHTFELEMQKQAYMSFMTKEAEKN